MQLFRETLWGCEVFFIHGQEHAQPRKCPNEKENKAGVGEKKREETPKDDG